MIFVCLYTFLCLRLTFLLIKISNTIVYHQSDVSCKVGDNVSYPLSGTVLFMTTYIFRIFASISMIFFSDIFEKKKMCALSLPLQLLLISPIINDCVSNISYAECKKLQVEEYSVLPFAGYLIVDFSVISSSGSLIVTTSSCAPTVRSRLRGMQFAKCTPYDVRHSHPATVRRE